MRRLQSIVVLAALVACSPKPAGPSAPEPSAAAQQTFGKNCTWGKVESLGLQIWSYACDAEFGGVKLAPSATGFDLTGEGGSRQAIVVFNKAPSDPVDAILPGLRAASPGPDTANCILSRNPLEEPDGAKRESYRFRPSDAVENSWRQALETGEGPTDPPCGRYGPQMAGDIAVIPVEGATDKVAVVDFGSEIQVFDATTLRAAQ